MSHLKLGPFLIERQVGNSAYQLRLPVSMKRLHPVFNVVKLMLALTNPIVGRCFPPPPLPEIVKGEEEWMVEEILDSKVINLKLWYLVKWKDFKIEHNSWEPWDNVHAPELVAEFYQKHMGVARHIRSTKFNTIAFKLLVPRHHFLEGGGECQGTPNFTQQLQIRPKSKPRPTSQVNQTKSALPPYRNSHHPS
jgi:chromodomain-containing protein